MRSDLDQLKGYLGQIIETREILIVKNIHRYRDLKGRLPAYRMRFENLEKDFHEVTAKLGLGCRSPLPHAKMGIQADGLDPRDLLSRQQIETINELFREEFETYGYPLL